MADNTLGLPKGLKFYSPGQFGGMDLQASPLAMADSDFYLRENFLKLGNGYLRTAWDVGDALYTATGGVSIISFAAFTIGTSYYFALFLSDGSAIQVAWPTGAVTQIGRAGTFYVGSTGYLPDCSQWGALYLLVSNRNTQNDFWAWDGSLLYGAGTAAPNGAVLQSGGFNYATAPTVTPFGGSGTGLVVMASVSGGNVVELQVTNPGTGYQPGDVVQLAFSGGGADSSPILTANLSVKGVGGATITNPGTGYTAATAAFSGGGGTGAAASVTVSGGVVTQVTITAPGSGYTTAPTITISGDGTGAAATAVLQPSGVQSVTVVNGGSGFTAVPGVTFQGGGGAGATGLAVLAPTSIAAINLTAGGTGYTSAPAVTIVGGQAKDEPTSIASANATESGGVVTSIAIVSGGSGYISVPVVTLTGGGGTGALARAVISGGAVTSVVVVAGGSGYASAPTVVFSGGGSSGLAATAEAILVGDQVGYVTITDPGGYYTSASQVEFSGGGGTGAGGNVVYSPTSIASVVISSTGQYYTSAPAVVVSSGANGSAYATVSLMPYGVSGSSLETFNSRVWVANPAPSQTSTRPPGGNFQYSAAGGFTDFSTPDGGGLFVSTDRFLQVQYNNIRQSNGYLYFFGDGSVSVVSNIQTSGSPTITTFTYQNVDPQVGLSWRDTIQDFGRSVISGNLTGVYGLYGGNVTKISGKLDRLFVNAIFPPTQGALTPSSAVATLFDVKHYMMLMTIIDPDTGLPRNVMATWDEKEWCLTSQSVDLKYIGTQKVSSSLTAWGTDGISLYPLFSRPSSILTKRLDTKHYGLDSQFLVKDIYSTHISAQDLSPDGEGVTMTLAYVVSGPTVAPTPTPFNETTLSQIVPGVEAMVTAQVKFQAAPPFWPIWSSGTKGLYFTTVGMRLTSGSPDFVLANLMLGYVPVSFVG